MQLKDNIQREIDAVTSAIFLATFRNMERQVQMCLDGIMAITSNIFFAAIMLSIHQRSLSIYFILNYNFQKWKSGTDNFWGTLH